MQTWTLESDLENIMHQTETIWPDLHTARIFITGGTGFIGCWLLETLKYANENLNLGMTVTILTRNAASFKKKAPHIASYSAFNFIEGNIGNFVFPEGNFSHVIHAATDASADLNEHNPLQMFNTIVQGTQRILEFARAKNAKRTLFLSSGAVYGQQPWDIINVSECWMGGPSCVDPKATYAEAKRAAELLCSIYQKQYDMEIAIARIFALLGPYLSLDIHFAAGNFIRDAMDGKKIIVNGNGKPCRSYLYAADLTVWLLHILVRAGSCKPYNVGSEETISIKELAQTTAQLLAKGEYEILEAKDAGWNHGRYVPDTRLIQQDLGLKQTVSLEQAIIRTAIWNGWKGNK